MQILHCDEELSGDWEPSENRTNAPLDAAYAAIAEAISRGENVFIPGVGRFSFRDDAPGKMSFTPVTKLVDQLGSPRA